MSVRIRMKRMGRRHRPFYRICIMDQRTQRDGKSIEDVGTYDPMVKDKAQRVSMNMERIDYWLSVGAQPSEKVGALIKKVRLNKFGSAKPLPPMTAPKPLPEPEPEPAAEESTEASEETTAEAAPTEEKEGSEG